LSSSPYPKRDGSPSATLKATLVSTSKASPVFVTIRGALLQLERTHRFAVVAVPFVQALANPDVTTQSALAVELRNKDPRYKLSVRVKLGTPIRLIRTRYSVCNFFDCMSGDSKALSTFLESFSLV
jgi:hypothetical protein